MGLYSKKTIELSWQRRIFSKVISFFCRARQQREISSNPKKILVIQWDYLGDIIVSTPALTAVRDLFPNSIIELLVSPEVEPYINGLPYVDKISYFQNPLHMGKTAFGFKRIFKAIGVTRKDEYGLVIELSGRLPNQLFLLFLKARYIIGQNPTNDFSCLDKSVCSKACHQITRNLEVIKLIKDFEVGQYAHVLYNPVAEEDREYVKKILNARRVVKNIIIIHSVSSWVPKQWPLESYVEVIKYLLKENRTVCLIGSAGEFKKIERIRNTVDENGCFNLAGLINLRQTLALMERSELFIGSDSGPMHLAAIVKLNGIVLFGPGDPDRWAYPFHKVIYKKPSCSPCPQFAFKKTCIKGLPTCKGLLDIKPDEVIRACEAILKN